MTPSPATRKLAVRRRVLDVVRERPGLTSQEIADVAGLGWTAAKTALRTLIDEGKVSAGQPVKDARHRCYYPADLSLKRPTPYVAKEA